MAAVSKTIGATARDYATITLWEAADGGGDGLGNDDCTGTIYDDATPSLSENPEIDFSANSATLTANTKHDGNTTPGAGVVVQAASGALPVIWVSASDPGLVTIEWLDLDHNGSNIVAIDSTLYIAGGSSVVVQNCLIHNGDSNRAATAGCGIFSTGAATTIDVFNNIVFNYTNSSSGLQIGLRTVNTSTTRVYNNTVANITNDRGAGADATGIVIADDADQIYKNNLVYDVTSTAGSANDWSDSAPANATHAENISEDATSPDAAHRNASITFVDAANDDYHLVVGDTDAIDNGEDLGAVANVDIDNYDRDAGAVTWDIGAHEYQAVGGFVSRPEGVIGGSLI
jgi:hypothetical protein